MTLRVRPHSTHQCNAIEPQRVSWNPQHAHISNPPTHSMTVMWSKKGTHTARRPWGSWPDLCACTLAAMQVRNVSVGPGSSLYCCTARVLLLLGMCRLNDCLAAGGAVWGLRAVAGQQNLLWIMSKQTIECASLCGATQLSHDFTAAACRCNKIISLYIFPAENAHKRATQNAACTHSMWCDGFPPFSSRSFPSSKNFLCPKWCIFKSNIYLHRERALLCLLLCVYGICCDAPQK